MSKTIKELANELGISRQRVQQIISQQVASKRPKKVAGQYVLSKTDESLIILALRPSKKLNKANADKQVADKLHATLQAEIADLRQQLTVKDQQMAAKDSQIEKMQTLLAQSQQLQLLAERKLKELAVPQSEMHSDEQPPAQPPTNFWSRLIGNHRSKK